MYMGVCINSHIVLYTPSMGEIKTIESILTNDGTIDCWM